MTWAPSLSRRWTPAKSPQHVSLACQNVPWLPGMVDERLCFRPCLYRRSAIFSTLRRGLLQSHVPGDRRSNILWNSKALFRQIQESTMLSALQTGLTHFETVGVCFEHSVAVFKSWCHGGLQRFGSVEASISAGNSSASSCAIKKSLGQLGSRHQ